MWKVKLGATPGAEALGHFPKYSLKFSVIKIFLEIFHTPGFCSNIDYGQNFSPKIFDQMSVKYSVNSDIKIEVRLEDASLKLIWRPIPHNYNVDIEGN